jgi:hypothetical protein
MTMTAMHDRYLTLQSNLKRTPLECYHWAEALRLFTRDLQMNTHKRQADAIWMTAGMMCWVALCAVETDDPQDVWPLSQSKSTDGLTWLEMQKGLRAIWRMITIGVNCDLYRGDTFPPSQRCLGVELPNAGLDGIPDFLIRLCDLDANSNSSNNPYYALAHVLALLISEPKPMNGTLRFLAFPNSIESDFECLLKAKDPYALALMAVWYENVEDFWWISDRASLERAAITLYLNQHHADNPRIADFLAYSTLHDKPLPMTYGSKSGLPGRALLGISNGWQIFFKEKLPATGSCVGHESRLVD